MSSSSRMRGDFEAAGALSEKCRGLLLGLLGQLSFSAVGEVDARWWEGCWWRWRWRRKREEAIMMQKRRMEMEEPMVIPVMAPAVKLCFVWTAEEERFVFVTDTGGRGEWSMVIMFGSGFAGKSACETEKFRCSKSTNRYASWRNARPSVY